MVAFCRIFKWQDGQEYCKLCKEEEPFLDVHEAELQTMNADIMYLKVLKWNTFPS